MNNQFQAEVGQWMTDCFGEQIAQDKMERSFRFLEEAIELIQVSGVSRENAHALVDYVFNRPVGELEQECGGVMVTLAAFCYTHGISMTQCGGLELARVWTKMEQIRAKQAAKTIKSGPLP